MLSVASVAMIEGILKPRISPPFTSPRPTPASRITADPIRIWTFVESVPIRNEAITTPNVTIAPTERSSAPTSRACVWPIATIASGTARNRTLVTFRSLMNPGNFDSAYHITSPIRINCRTTGIHSRKRTTLRHLFLSRASRRTLRTAILAESVRAVLTRRSATDASAWRSRAASVPAFDRPGPRTIASTMRSSSSSSPGISSMICPRDITSTRSHNPANSNGSLDFTSMAAPPSVRERSAS